MSTTSSAAPASPSVEPAKPCPFERYVKPFLTPYYMVVAGVLGAATVGLVVFVVVLVIISANFNVLGAIE